MRNPITRTAGVLAVLFGLLTLMAGGRILIGGAAARTAAGDIVPFVLWFNTTSGLLYIAAGVGLVARRKWAAPLSVVISVAILVVFAAFGVHIAFGGAFEARTVFAMILRSTLWIMIAAIACRTLGCRLLPSGARFGTR